MRMVEKTIRKERRELGLYQVYGNSIHIFKNVIPMSVRAAESPAEGVSIYTHDGKGKVALAYEVLTKEIANNG